MSPPLDQVSTTSVYPPAIIRAYNDYVEEPVGDMISYVESKVRGFGTVASSLQAKRFVPIPAKLAGYQRTSPDVSLNQTPLVAAQDQWERVFQDLGSLMSSDGFVAPDRTTLRDFETVAQIIAQKIPFPEIDHDDSNGVLSLRWYSDIDESMFSLTFTGSGFVVATLVPPVDGALGLWKYKVSEELKILATIDEPRVARVINAVCATV